LSGIAFAKKFLVLEVEDLGELGTAVTNFVWECYDDVNDGEQQGYAD
jgi:hypothetical protein